MKKSITYIVPLWDYLLPKNRSICSQHLNNSYKLSLLASPTYYLLPTTYYLLPTTHYPLPTTYYLLPKNPSTDSEHFNMLLLPYFGLSINY